MVNKYNSEVHKNCSLFKEGIVCVQQRIKKSGATIPKCEIKVLDVSLSFIIIQ